MQTSDPILTEIDAFLSDTGMGASYFGKKAVGNSEIVARLRAGGRIWPETRDKLRTFIHTKRCPQIKAAHRAAQAERARQ